MKNAAKTGLTATAALLLNGLTLHLNSGRFCICSVLVSHSARGQANVRSKRLSTHDSCSRNRKKYASFLRRMLKLFDVLWNARPNIWTNFYNQNEAWRIRKAQTCGKVKQPTD